MFFKRDWQLLQGFVLASVPKPESLLADGGGLPQGLLVLHGSVRRLLGLLHRRLPAASCPSKPAPKTQPAEPLGKTTPRREHCCTSDLANRLSCFKRPSLILRLAKADEEGRGPTDHTYTRILQPMALESPEPEWKVVNYLPQVVVQQFNLNYHNREMLPDSKVS